ncbi:MAG: hypothetical protein IJ194_03695, partial [Bacilli bacterium]|nr:hypothetical protein [Bacilli bacterium]
TDRLCLWGHSAGGHLALLYSYLSKVSNNTFGVLSPINITLVVSEAGPTDLHVLYNQELPPEQEWLRERLVRAVGSNNYSDLDYSSPKIHAPFASQYLNSYLIFGGRDNLIDLAGNMLYEDGIGIKVASQIDHSGFTYEIDNSPSTCPQYDSPESIKQLLDNYKEE